MQREDEKTSPVCKENNGIEERQILNKERKKNSLLFSGTIKTFVNSSGKDSHYFLTKMIIEWMLQTLIVKNDFFLN